MAGLLSGPALYTSGDVRQQEKERARGRWCAETHIGPSPQSRGARFWLCLLFLTRVVRPCSFVVQKLDACCVPLRAARLPAPFLFVLFFSLALFKGLARVPETTRPRQFTVDSTVRCCYCHRR